MPRLLLVRSEHLGDVAVTLPGAALLRRALPAAHLTYLVAPGLGGLPRRSPAVDDVLELGFPPPEEPFRPDRWERTVARQAPRLAGRFDAAILFRPHEPWATVLTERAGIPIRAGFRTGGARRMAGLTHSIRHRPALGAVEGSLALARLVARLAGGRPRSDPPAGPLLAPRPEDDQEAEGALSSLALSLSDRPMVVHPGVGWQLKAWPARRWGRVAAHLASRWGRPVVVTGTGAEASLVEEVVEWSGGSAGGLAGQVSLGGLVGLLSASTVLVGADSGPLHLAALLGVPVVGVYGPFSASRAAPWTPPGRRRGVELGLACSPCGTLVRPPCGARSHPACIAGIEVPQVVAAADDLLRSLSADVLPG